MGSQKMLKEAEGRSQWKAWAWVMESMSYHTQLRPTNSISFYSVPLSCTQGHCSMCSFSILITVNSFKVLCWEGKESRQWLEKGHIIQRFCFKDKKGNLHGFVYLSWKIQEKGKNLRKKVNVSHSAVSDSAAPRIDASSVSGDTWICLQ